jgi:hypothetical protein
MAEGLSNGVFYDAETPDDGAHSELVGNLFAEIIAAEYGAVEHNLVVSAETPQEQRVGRLVPFAAQLMVRHTMDEVVKHQKEMTKVPVYTKLKPDDPNSPKHPDEWLEDEPSQG